ncbi:DUF4038 domain-containing protein [Kribbella turkmenica]|uniref:DUF4038 domain-containing protein n=1 Tax=Kribbella turkmenica TaxID=2530375 RepID=A0A4R4WTR0_9ACTN|nr:DUF4038 domain-containing protein [Kribbella turkmenica]TDD21004.1 DUF4038 domain-containing protein [Kribbella turkmenica]
MSISVWREHEFVLTRSHEEQYTAEVSADFEHESGLRLRRPAFWDGGDTWRVRFAAPEAGRWQWSSGDDTGEFGVTPPEGEHPFYAHGFWRMSPGGRSLVHADGTPAILAADTAWALPWRATPEQVREYAADRQAKGFNAVLLMTVQPDMRAVGPRDRTQDDGFAVGFEDLPEGHLNRPHVEYFQYLDVLLRILVDHGLVPVLQPVFHGFGWKGLDVAGTVVPPVEYARYCRYLVARYGAQPAIYLVGGDGSGREPQIAAGGAEVHASDCYGQPTGIHYRPHVHPNAHQDADWLDFQWCQTGHTGEHVPERVADMWRNLPVKAVANGEPTYENTGRTAVAAGWWQGHEAWSNLCAGGTMGVVYGAGSLWQWKLHPDEPGHSEYFAAPGAGWREAVGFEGSAYVGLLTRILDGVPTTDMKPDWTRVISGRALTGMDGTLIVYRDDGGPVMVFDDTVPLAYTIVDPRDGAVVTTGKRDSTHDPLPDPGGAPRVYICRADL